MKKSIFYQLYKVICSLIFNEDFLMALVPKYPIALSGNVLLKLKIKIVLNCVSTPMPKFLKTYINTIGQMSKVN